MARALFAAAVISVCLLAAQHAPAVETAEETDLLLLKKAFENGSYAIVQDGVKDFLEKYPSTQRMDELQMLLGRTFFYENAFRRALDEFSAVASLPSSALQDDAIYWIGETYFSIQDFKQAIGYFQRIIDEFRSSRLIVFAYYSKAWSYYMLDDLEGAVESFRDVVANFPHDRLAMEARFKAGEALYLLRRHREALAEFKAYIDTFPVSDRTPDAIFLCGEASLRLGDAGSAAAYFKNALAMGGKSAWRDVASYELGRAYLDAADLRAGLGEFSLLAETGANADIRSAAILGMAKSLTGLNRLAEARSLYDEAAKDPLQRSRLDRVYYGKAEVEFGADDYAEAGRLSKEALLEFPASKLTHEFRNMLGNSYLALDEMAAARSEFERLADSAAPEGLKSKAFAAIGDICAKESNYSGAIEAFDKALQIAPKGEVAQYAQYQIGANLLAWRRYEEASLAFRSLLVSFPDSGLREKALYMLAFAHFKKSDFTAAMAWWQEFLKSYPSSEFEVYALFYLANSMYELEMFSDALGVFRRIMETRGGDDLAVLARYRAAWCHYNVRNEKAALAEFEDIAKRYPHSGIAEDIAYWLGEYYYSHGMSKDAERQFTLFLEKFPSGELAEYAQFHLALLAEDALEHEKALREFLELGRRYPAGRLAPEARLRAAGLLVKMSRPDEAIRLYEAVVSEFPKTDFAFLAHRKMAAVLKDERRYDEAAGNLKKGMALGRPEEAAELHYGLGECFEEKGDLPRAKEEYLSIPRLYPKDKFWPIRALLAAAKASEKLGQREEAERIYERLAGGDVEESKFARERLEAIRGKQTTDYKLPSTKK